MSARRHSGSTALELVVSTSFVVCVLGAGTAVTASSLSLASTSASGDASSIRAARTLRAAADEIRAASLGSLRDAAGAPLSDGASADALVFRRVIGYSGGQQTDSDVSLRFVPTEADGSGEIVRTQDGAEETLVRGATSLSFRRSGDVVTVTVGTRAGPGDDRARLTTGVVSVRPRNP